MQKGAGGTVSPRLLVILAALIWSIGGIVLVLKASSLLFAAEELAPARYWPWLSIGVGVGLGALKARFLFSTRCRQNLKRIAALKQPRIWQCFRPGFFAVLAVMIAAGSILSRLAHGDYLFLHLVAILDLSIGSALLGSSIVFWTHRPATAVQQEQ
jgi:hypothetical protein